MRTRSIVLGLTACLIAGTFGIVTTITSGSGESTSRAAPSRTAGLIVPNRPHHGSDPALDRVISGVGDGSVDPQAAHEALLEALERDPAGTLAVLQDFLADADPRQQATRTVVGALVAVGTPEMQDALVRLVDGRIDDAGFVKLVVPTLGFLARPTVATEEAVRVLSTDAAPEATRMNAHLTLGVMASRFSHGDAPRGTAIVERYAAQLATAKTDDERRRWLSVLGNAGTPEAAAAIEAQLDTADPILRGRALEALRRVVAPEADQRLVHALDDRDARVRNSAAWSLSYRQATPETLHVLLGKLAKESDEKVATMLLDVVWPRRATDPAAVLATVQSVAEGHPSLAVRKRARGLLDAKT